MLKKLMDMVNLKWAKKARIVEALQISKGQGSYPYLTVREGSLYFHSYPQVEEFDSSNDPDNPLYFQQVVMEGLTIEELVDSLQGMGYVVDASEAERLRLLEESALILMETPMSLALNDPCIIFSFTSNFWRVLYPIHRVLTKYNGDVDIAIEQLMLPSTRGEWLDYWVSFFRIRRLPDETDELLLRRTFLTLTSAKSNNKAMEELISYYIGTDASVLDDSPARIEVRVDPYFMDSATKVRDIIVLLKGAGVDYFLNYQKGFDERYRDYYRDKYGATFGTKNESFNTVSVTLPVYAEDYLYVPLELRKGFVLNTHTLNSDRVLSKPDIRIVESLGMELKDAATGEIIKQA